MKRVLVVDDEAQIRTLLKISLGAKGWEVFEAATGFEGLQELPGVRPDLVLLDLGLPDGDGSMVLRDIRAFSTVPVIVVSARGGETDIVSLLESGADDYVTKPFNTNELAARMTSVVRRRDHNESVYTSGDMSIDLADRRVSKAGSELHLTPTEYSILAVLARAAGKIVTQNSLLLELWGPHTANDSGNLRVHLAGLRKKIEDDPGDPTHIITEPGVGYRLK